VFSSLGVHKHGHAEVTGRTLQIARDIMTADAFDAWVKTFGESIIKERAEKMFLGSLGGRARAKRAVKSELATDVGSEFFKTSVQEELNWMPTFVFKQSADRCRSVTLLTGYESETVVAVPRAPIRDAFCRRRLKTDHGASAEC